METTENLNRPITLKKLKWESVSLCKEVPDGFTGEFTKLFKTPKSPSYKSFIPGHRKKVKVA